MFNSQMKAHLHSSNLVQITDLVPILRPLEKELEVKISLCK